MKEPDVSRREFSQRLAALSAAFAGLLASVAFFGRRRAGAAPLAPATTGAARKRWGMVIDLDRCTGCGACNVACHTENNVPVAGPDPALRGTEIHWMELLPQAVDQPSTGSHSDMIPLPCMHCENPPCVKVCPVNATYQTEDGLVAQVWDRCIGCRYCQVACPYGRRYFNWTQPGWLEEQRSSLNPDVATRPLGVVEKCTFCSHRIRRVSEEARTEGREVSDADVQRLPACAQICPAEAITFGDLEDPESRVAKLTASPRAFRLLEHLGTRPKVVYLSKDPRA